MFCLQPDASPNGNEKVLLDAYSSSLFTNGVVFAKVLNATIAEEAKAKHATKRSGAPPRVHMEGRNVLEIQDSGTQMAKLYNWNTLVPELERYAALTLDWL